MRVRDVLYYEAGVAARPLPRFGRCAPLVSTAALQPSFNGSLRLPSFSRGLRPLVSTQPLAASSIVWCAISRFYQLVSMEGRFSI